MSKKWPKEYELAFPTPPPEPKLTAEEVVAKAALIETMALLPRCSWVIASHMADVVFEMPPDIRLTVDESLSWVTETIELKHPLLALHVLREISDSAFALLENIVNRRLMRRYHDESRVAKGQPSHV